jgi:hypothetical protein
MTDLPVGIMLRDLRIDNEGLKRQLDDARKMITGLRDALAGNEQQRELDRTFADLHLSQANARIQELEAAQHETCSWKYDDSPDWPSWETACGAAFCYEDGGPEDNDNVYCSKCGKRIVDVSPPYPESNEPS